MSYYCHNCDAVIEEDSRTLCPRCALGTLMTCPECEGCREDSLHSGEPCERCGGKGAVPKHPPRDDGYTGQCPATNCSRGHIVRCSKREGHEDYHSYKGLLWWVSYVPPTPDAEATPSPTPTKDKP